MVFLSRPVAAVTCAGINSNTGLVVNLGWSGFSVTPVIHGVPLLWNEKLSPIGGKYVCNELKQKTDAKNFEDPNLNFYDDLIARLGYIKGFEYIKEPTEVNILTIDLFSILKLNKNCVFMKF